MHQDSSSDPSSVMRKEKKRESGQANATMLVYAQCWCKTLRLPAPQHAILKLNMARLPWIVDAGNENLTESDRKVNARNLNAKRHVSK